MSALKSLLLFGISLVAAACFDSPQFPVTPQIEFESIYFQEGETTPQQDALVLKISFRDGDGDLGLASTDIDPPFHDVNYFVADGAGLVALQKRTLDSALPQVVEVPADAKGKLVIARTSRNPFYKDIVPPYIDEHSSCTDYTYTTVYVTEDDKHIFDKSYHYDSLTYANFRKIYSVTDTFYYRKNPNYSNIDVEFWVKDGNDFKLFDWEKEFCTISFDQRFHVLIDEQGPLEGKLEYSMTTSGMKSVFGIQTLKLKIRVRDRSLNNSNQIETPEFTLDKITKG